MLRLVVTSLIASSEAEISSCLQEKRYRATNHQCQRAFRGNFLLIFRFYKFGLSGIFSIPEDFSLRGLSHDIAISDRDPGFWKNPVRGENFWFCMIINQERERIFQLIIRNFYLAIFNFLLSLPINLASLSMNCLPINNWPIRWQYIGSYLEVIRIRPSNLIPYWQRIELLLIYNWALLIKMSNLLNEHTVRFILKRHNSDPIVWTSF